MRRLIGDIFEGIRREFGIWRGTYPKRRPKPRPRPPRHPMRFRDYGGSDPE